MNSHNAVELRDISLAYAVNSNGPKKGVLGKVVKTKTTNQIFENFNLDIKKGEILGVIGTNGAGKSTLLSLIAKIMEPDSGTVEINGKVATILELSMGFHPDLTGRENIILKGELYGFRKKEIEAIVDEIADYSGIGTYIDNPVRTYSSGMKSRLAFSIMIHVKADIMLVDEILSTGDIAFSTKASDYFKKILKDGKTVVYVSHSTGSVESLCTRVIWIDKGKIVADGKPKKICGRYKEAIMGSIDVLTDQAESGLSDAQYRLGMLYKNGADVKANPELYLYWIKMAAEQGHLKAQIEYSDYLLQSNEPSCKEKATEYLSLASLRGDTSARMKLSSIIGGSDLDYEYELVKRIMKQASDTGGPSDILNYANFLLKVPLYEKNLFEAFKLFKLLSDKYDHPDAIIQLATMYKDGIGTEKNIESYLAILKKGASLGVLKAINQLANIYNDGIIVDEDVVKSFELYELGAQRGSPNCQYNVATMYMNGIGTEINLEKARYWYDMYAKSQLIAYQIQSLETLRSHSYSNYDDASHLFSQLLDSKNAKAMIEVCGIMNNAELTDLWDIANLEEVYKKLSKLHGKAMNMALSYHSKPNSRGFDLQKAVDLCYKLRYDIDIEVMSKIADAASKSADEQVKQSVNTLREYLDNQK